MGRPIWAAINKAAIIMYQKTMQKMTVVYMHPDAYRKLVQEIVDAYKPLYPISYMDVLLHHTAQQMQFEVATGAITARPDERVRKEDELVFGFTEELRIEVEPEDLLGG